MKPNKPAGKMKDLKGGIDLGVETGSVSYKHFFEKRGDKVYEVYKLGNDEWREREMPFFKEVPYSILPRAIPRRKV